MLDEVAAAEGGEEGADPRQTLIDWLIVLPAILSQLLLSLSFH